MFATRFYLPRRAFEATMILASDGEALTGVWFEGQKYAPQMSAFREIPGGALPVLAKTKDWLYAYFAGERPLPMELPLAPQGSAFQKSVWNILLTIPYVQTMTYGEIAGQIGCKSAQAVGGAVGHNPISIIVPCHRVLGAQGRLTGYAGGVDKKEWLLRHEGAGFRE